MKLTPNFSLEEFLFSETATRLGIDNKPDDQQLANLLTLANHMEEVRAHLGHPIIITSGLRVWALNAAIGGSRTSFHPYGLAADFKCPGFGSPLDICHRLADTDMPFDQLINEFDQWTHIGFPLPGTPARRQLLTAKRERFQVVYIPGLHTTKEVA